MTAGTPPPHPISETRGRPMLFWSLVAAVGGLLAFVLPTLLFPRAQPEPAYGHPLIPWLATVVANLRYLPGMAAFFVLGLVLGAAQPRRRLLMAFLSGTLVFVLHCVNIAGDVHVDPTDHNLLPFELLFLGAVVAPVVPGVFLGALFGRKSGG